MTTTPSPACKVCGTGRPLPPDATFCPNCGRPAPVVPVGGVAVVWAAGVGLAVLLLLGLGVMLIVAGSRRSTGPALAVSVPTHSSAVAAGAVPPTTVPGAMSAAAPVAPPTDLPTAPTAPTAPTDPTAPLPPITAPVRPGDTDLTADPLALYAGGPPADRLSVRGLRLGLPMADVPPALLADSAPDHLRDDGGDLYAVDDGRISEIHVRDPDLLARWPIDSVNALVGHFGRPGDVYRGDGNDAFPTYLYPDRGVHVRWDEAAGRILEVVLVRPTPRAGGG